jgi:hypothetical protein
LSDVRVEVLLHIIDNHNDEASAFSGITGGENEVEEIFFSETGGDRISGVVSTTEINLSETITHSSLEAASESVAPMTRSLRSRGLSVPTMISHSLESSTTKLHSSHIINHHISYNGEQLVSIAKGDAIVNIQKRTPAVVVTEEDSCLDICQLQTASGIAIELGKAVLGSKNHARALTVLAALLSFLHSSHENRSALNMEVTIITNITSLCRILSSGDAAAYEPNLCEKTLICIATLCQCNDENRLFYSANISSFVLAGACDAVMKIVQRHIYEPNIVLSGCQVSLAFLGTLKGQSSFQQCGGYGALLRAMTVYVDTNAEIVATAAAGVRILSRDTEYT